MCTQYIYKYKMNDDDPVDLLKAERYRAEAEAFELFRKDWDNGSGVSEL